MKVADLMKADLVSVISQSDIVRAVANGSI